MLPLLPIAAALSVALTYKTGQNAIRKFEKKRKRREKRNAKI
jgi:hypothetical protein